MEGVRYRECPLYRGFTVKQPKAEQRLAFCLFCILGEGHRLLVCMASTVSLSIFKFQFEFILRRPTVFGKRVSFGCEIFFSRSLPLAENERFQRTKVRL